MNTFHIHNVVSAKLSPVRTLQLTAIDNTKGRACHLRELVLIDDEGHKTTITFFAHALPEQIALAADQPALQEA